MEGSEVFVRTMKGGRGNGNRRNKVAMTVEKRAIAH
jgi:hypothetical protein